MTDTICEWCLNPSISVKNRLLTNVNFKQKCLDLIHLQKEFHDLLKDQRYRTEFEQIVVIKPVYYNDINSNGKPSLSDCKFFKFFFYKLFILCAFN